MMLSVSLERTESTVREGPMEGLLEPARFTRRSTGVKKRRRSSLLTHVVLTITAGQEVIRRFRLRIIEPTGPAIYSKIGSVENIC
ncbi:hypothetical protein ANCDUO_10208 [Ancylostoma duodenale]|uniref:Uncharacterized protein n=1 Tax=Ancylostoma duodenale TaxID=51022 RepID=A0A0C2GKX8_9BILA|nr:hypothetical protein ANCDUO_10208 [Ancylostoma duodenale]